MKEFAVRIGVLLFLAGGLLAAEQPSSPKDPGLVMRVTTRMVLVDAVVLDKEGHPVMGLKPEDFTVTEGGVRQRIASFAERNSEHANRAAPPVLPPHVTTNRPAITQANSENGTVAVLLLDGLNTPAQNQIYVKQQMLKFLARQYDPNTKLAVIALTNKLTVLQNFTQDPLHFLLGLFGHHPWPAGDIAIFRGRADGITHIGDAALINQVHDQLHCVQTLEVRHLGRVPCFDKCFESGLN